MLLEQRAPFYMAGLRRELSQGHYHPQPLKGAYIPKPHGGWRIVGVPTVPDRVAQRACLNVLLPLLEPQLEMCSYAYRPGRSIEDAITQIERWRDQGHSYLLDADIENCFDSIDRESLQEVIQRYVEDKRLVALIHQWLEAGVLWPTAGETPCQW